MKKSRPTISAYVITIGEPTLADCLRHLKKQTLPLDFIDVVANMPGYANARNEVHRRVDTDYFLPVDADMLLHPRCVEILFSKIVHRPEIFDVVGRLHDPLLGSIMGIHLLRTDAVKHVAYEDSIVGDAIFMDGMSQQYHKVVLERVVGLHRPDYCQLVQLYHKFTREGEKIRTKENAGRFRMDFKNLLQAYRRGNHSAAIALIFLCHGLFTNGESSYNYLEYDNARAQTAAQLVAEVLKLSPSSEDTWKERMFHRHYYYLYLWRDLINKVQRRLSAYPKTPKCHPTGIVDAI
ncbi:MAG: hypothetical protein ACREOO_20955 [bacterium]